MPPSRSSRIRAERFRTSWYSAIHGCDRSVIDSLVSTCDSILPQLQGEVLTRSYRFTEEVNEFRVSTAFTDRWVCFRATGLCPEDEFPEKDEDEADDAEEEL
ncbi:hypothetical protein AK812_SmicGene5143 [Symbiodinium microadriaticum]|uniref:Uncharacterized protein n=1 Tax=Symbiodinium microadriaticum TaxID=2951 RepID=A0A1Q9EUF1_SYMMI|nr:hypothetical protein AK812_SmicGene5143 [Symbiodinium microadriaticum]